MKLIITLLMLLHVLLSNDDSPRAAEPVKMKGIVERHNHWRKEVGIGPLKWSDKLAKVAQGWANKQSKKDCGCVHSPDDKYGENIYCSEGIDSDPKDIVDDWASEKEYYDHVKGRCKGGECGHYTQIVWQKTTEVGCGMAKCGGKEIWVCNYNPPGNYVNQKPY